MAKPPRARLSSCTLHRTDNVSPRTKATRGGKRFQKQPPGLALEAHSPPQRAHEAPTLPALSRSQLRVNATVSRSALGGLARPSGAWRRRRCPWGFRQASRLVLGRQEQSWLLSHIAPLLPPKRNGGNRIQSRVSPDFSVSWAKPGPGWAPRSFLVCPDSEPMVLVPLPQIPEQPAARRVRLRHFGVKPSRSGRRPSALSPHPVHRASTGRSSLTHTERGTCTSGPLAPLPPQAESSKAKPLSVSTRHGWAHGGPDLSPGTCALLGAPMVRSHSPPRQPRPSPPCPRAQHCWLPTTVSIQNSLRDQLSRPHFTGEETEGPRRTQGGQARVGRAGTHTCPAAVYGPACWALRALRYTAPGHHSSSVVLTSLRLRSAVTHCGGRRRLSTAPRRSSSTGLENTDGGALGRCESAPSSPAPRIPWGCTPQFSGSPDSLTQVPTLSS